MCHGHRARDRQRTTEEQREPTESTDREDVVDDDTSEPEDVTDEETPGRPLEVVKALLST